MGEAAVGGIDVAVAADDALVDGAAGNLVGGVPVSGIGHAGDGEAVVIAAAGIAHQAVELAQVVGALPGAVEAHDLAGNQHRAVEADRRRHARHGAAVAEAADLDLREVPLEPVDGV